MKAHEGDRKDPIDLALHCMRVKMSLSVPIDRARLPVFLTMRLNVHHTMTLRPSRVGSLAADVSVTFPRVMENYRMAHAIAVRLSLAEASTEEVRTVMIHYRSIFDELVHAQKPHERKSAA
jgi:hypothetical protein